MSYLFLRLVRFAVEYAMVYGCYKVCKFIFKLWLKKKKEEKKDEN